MKVKNAVSFVFLLLLILKTEVIFGQDAPVLADSSSFVDFLKSHGEIPGLQFRLVDPYTIKALDSTFTNYSTALEFQASLLQSDSSAAIIQLLIDEEPSTLESAVEYVSILLRNGNIMLDSTDQSEGRDLISLANRERYSPLFKGALSYFSEFKIFAITLIIAIFFIFSLSMILFMLFFKALKNRKEKLMVGYDEQIVAPLSEILFEKSLEELKFLSDEELHQSFPASQLKKPIYVEMLVDRILALNKKMKGDFKLKLKALYKRLGLDKISINKLNSSKWAIVVTGLVEINEMDLTEAVPYVKKHVNSPNFHIRSQAVATLLNLSVDTNLYFLRDQTFPLSDWQQMNYLRIIKYLHATRDLRIDSLFDSHNKSIRIFGYKLIRVIGRVDLLADLEEKFNSVSEDEKIEIIKTFEYLGVPANINMINDSLRSDNFMLISTAAKAAGAIGDEKSVELICELLEKNPGFKLKMHFLRSLQNLDQFRYNKFVTEDTNADVVKIKMHLSDPLLQDV